MTRLGVGIVGTGFIARTHVDCFRRAALLFPEVTVEPEITIVADVTLPAAESFAAGVGAKRATAHWRAVIEDAEVDLVDICTPNNLHFPVAMAAIAAGKAVYCEKPLALSDAEARHMADAAAKAGVKTFVAFNNLFAPSTQLAKQLIQRGDIGTPLQFIGNFDQGFYSDPDLPASWRTRTAEAGSGALGDLGSHVISIAQDLVGPIVSVSAHDAIAFKDRPAPASGVGYAAKSGDDGQRLPVENDDFFQALVQFQGGAMGTIGASRVAPGRVFGINWEVRGTAGSLFVENERANELHVFRMQDEKDDRGFKTILCGSQIEGFKQGFFGFDYGGGGIGYFDVKVLEVRAMLLALQGHGRSVFDFEFGRQNQAVVDAVRASARNAGALQYIEG